MLARLAAWMCRGIRIPTADAVRIVESLDADSDGLISLGEVVQAVREVWASRRG